ncbi:M14-type cytosolic carboxypeptidase [Cognatishimia sp. SS12]|uniref:M14 family metallopeptidase n=1 Tax=Cognatishimia sp. SS12 TaxID=2979465 RepID=UPI00232C052F|nr:M14-type cytosolic carboxypeptidase [Cognatishimia sp. SS12]MDC0739581.1 M14-type cytosolic carboxypeptidase [Cognatishimia sp. SS12]
MYIDAGFDGGNIEVVSCDNPRAIDLKIQPDTRSGHAQWFYFRVLGGAGQQCCFRIVNAGDAAYPEAWPDGSVVLSVDGENWFRAPTRYADSLLTFEHNNESDVLYVALSPPYSAAQHQALVGRALSSEFCRLHAAIPTVEGRTIEVLALGNHAADAPAIWIIARQHPGEPMAEWFMEGLIDRLIDPQDALATKLRQSLAFYLVPNMNPDGSVAGHLRTNAAGIDLNRAWADPSPETCPEVAGVRALMDQRGVDAFLDIHGDEEFRFVFAAGCEGIPGFTEEMAEQDRKFRVNFRAENPDFSVKNGYPPDAPGAADLSIACSQIGHRFGCLAMTIEMPFKDNAARPDPIAGWGVDHSKALGRAVLAPIAKHFDL